MEASPEPQTPESIIPEVHSRLCAAYGCPVPYFGNRDPLSQLVSSLLSQRTVNKNKSIAYKALREAFPTWEAVRDAPEEDVREAINAATWPEQKAPRLQEVLRIITEKTGGLSLDFLHEMEEQAARLWLQSLPGIGPKTAAAVLCFSELRRRALPVDTHHFRVAMRLGLLPVGTGEAKAHDILTSYLPADWNAQDYYDHHEIMMFHGQRCCFYKIPDCARCVLLSLCPTGKARLGA